MQATGLTKEAIYFRSQVRQKYTGPSNRKLTTAESLQNSRRILHILPRSLHPPLPSITSFFFFFRFAYSAMACINQQQALLTRLTHILNNDISGFGNPYTPVLSAAQHTYHTVDSKCTSL